VDNDALPEEWEVLRDWLPGDLNALAREHDFFQRERGLTDAERWLRLILMHVAGGLSLEQTAMRARELGLAEISAVALFKRLRKARGWLESLCRHVLQEQQQRLGSCVWPSEYRVRAIDATDVREPGDTGTDWRIHYSIRIPELVCDHYELTDNTGGEKLGRFNFARNELVLADRGYSHRAGAAKVLKSGAALLVRWNPKSFPVATRGAADFKLLEHLQQLPVHSAREWAVQFDYEGTIYPLRLCAMRKSKVATERARRKAIEKARQHGRKPQEQCLALAAFVLVLTSLPKKFSAAQVLELYRCRWQVELTFKRLKSLLGAGHLPKSDDQSASAWMQAKILTALLLERLLLEAKIFSPWGYHLRNVEPVAAGAGGA
jgi:hypothetical protein